MLEDFLNACKDLGNEARAEENAGNGIDDKASKEDFIKFFDKKIKETALKNEKVNSSAEQHRSSSS